MSSPYFDFEQFDEPEDSRFYNMFQRLRSAPETDFGSYLPANDPDVLNYQKLATEPTGSERLISDYVGRRPAYEDYKPGFGRKLAAILVGSLSGSPVSGYNVSRSILNDPYERSLKDWQGEGTGITSRARLMDAERQRELAAAKYGLQNRVSQLRADETAKARKSSEARLLAGRVSAEEKANQDRTDRESHRAFQENLSKMIFDANQSHRSIMEENARQTQERLRQEALQRAKSAEEDDLIKQNKKLEAFASSSGITPNDYGNVSDMAQAIAFKKAMGNPAFADLIRETEDGFEFVEPKYGSDRIRILKDYLKSLQARYLRGEFK